MGLPYFVYPSVDGHLSCFNFLAIRKILLWPFLYTFLCGYMFSLFLVIYIGVEFGGCMINYMFTFWGCAKQVLTIFNLLVSFAVLFLTLLLLSFVSVPFYVLISYFLCSLSSVCLIFKSLVPCLVVQSCLTLCNPMDCSPPASSTQGILQERILEWVAMPSSRGSSQPRDQTQVSCIAGRFFTGWATREVHLSLLVICK